MPGSSFHSFWSIFLELAASYRAPLKKGRAWFWISCVFLQVSSRRFPRTAPTQQWTPRLTWWRCSCAGPLCPVWLPPDVAPNTWLSAQTSHLDGYPSLSLMFYWWPFTLVHVEMNRMVGAPPEPRLQGHISPSVALAKSKVKTMKTPPWLPADCFQQYGGSCVAESKEMGTSFIFNDGGHQLKQYNGVCTWSQNSSIIMLVQEFLQCHLGRCAFIYSSQTGFVEG